MIIRHINPLFTFTLLSYSNLVRSSATCYFPNGLPATDSTFQPCNPSGSGFSTCCNLGKEAAGLSIPDTCVSDGLCMAADPTSGNGLFFATGCTDQSMKDGSCPQMCAGATDSTHETYALNPCPDGKWCCLPWGGTINSTCCTNDGQNGVFEFDILSLRALNASASSTSSSVPSATSTYPCAADQCPPDNTFAVGMGVGISLGVTLLAALVAIAFLAVRVRRLQRGCRASGKGGPSELPANGRTVDPVELSNENKWSYANEIDGSQVSPYSERK